MTKVRNFSNSAPKKLTHGDERTEFTVRKLSNITQNNLL